MSPPNQRLKLPGAAILVFLASTYLKRGPGSFTLAFGLFPTMTSAEIRATVEREIAGDWSRTNAHRCDLRRCLVNPEKRRFQDESPVRAGMIELWVVLEELPASCDGYKIVYGEERRLFGLACPGIAGHEVFLGWYGTFLETFEAM
jgi:hypothetical protein